MCIDTYIYIYIYIYIYTYNSSNSSIHQEKSFDAQGEEMLRILEELHSSSSET